MAIGFGVFAQNNALQIRNVKKEQPQTRKKAASHTPKYDLSKLTATGKVPAKQTHFEWDNGSWAFYYNADISYHADGRKKAELLKDQSGKEMGRITYRYDAQNRPLEILTEMKSNSGWVPYYSTLMEYHAEGDLISQEERMWQNGAWTLLWGQKWATEYDHVNHTKTVIDIYFEDSQYDTSMKYIEHRENNVLIAEETHQYVGNNQFIPTEKYTYLFDNGIDTGMIKYAWDGTDWNEDLLYCNYEWNNPAKEFLTKNHVYIKLGSDWFLYEREIYTLDNFGSFSYLQEDYANGLWIGDMRIQTINDEHKNRIEYAYDLYLGGAWMQLFRIIEEYTYDTEGNILEHVYKETDSNGDLQPMNKDLFSDYLVQTGMNTIKSKSLGVFPNPASSTLYLKESLAGKTYQLKNVFGQTIASGKVDENSSIGVSEMDAGLYLLTIEDYQTKIYIQK